MRIPARFQLMDDDLEPSERTRKGSGRAGAFRSGNPEVRREVRLARGSDERKLRRAARAVRITVSFSGSTLDLRDHTFRNYRETCELTGKTPRLRAHINLELWNRLTVNYLRHCCTTYDNLLEQSRVLPGNLRPLFNQEIKFQVLDEIGRCFPHLAAECQRQRAYSGFSLEDHTVALPDGSLAAAA
ncbi:hypothetical protein [Pseudarthrobacter sp. AB1]|uniref:hypothetical protein n=1 Tax=Pseudarthrobacter sp. AB1 TaxID=2138309 RepID=UPI00186BAC7B|nr:hypothetical protein [Pseudarthrobacter sp. AB1]MBE4719506.1 hypothetical protein [Pseudarthrobacter sp. AB1]